MNPQNQPTEHSQGRQDPQPGQNVVPSASASAPDQVPAAPAAAPLSAPSTPYAPPRNYQNYTARRIEPATSNGADRVAPASPQPTEQSFYTPDESSQPSYSPGFDAAEPDTEEQYIPGHHDPDAVTWTASEFIAHQKDMSWYLVLGGGGFVLALVVYFVTRDVFNTIIVALAIGIFGFVGSRQPRELEYAVDSHGLDIGRKHYPYRDFRSFSIADDGPFHSITLMPLKRFMPPLSIYYDPADEERIAVVLANHLPLETHKVDMTDKLMRRIRF